MKRQDSTSESYFIVLFSFSLLVIAGIINSYSAGMAISAILSENSFYYLVKQVIFVIFGIVICYVFLKLKDPVIKYISPICVLLSVVCLSFGSTSQISFVRSQSFADFVFLSNIVYWSVFFSNRNNEIDKISDMLAPSLFTVATLFLVLVNYGFVYSCLFLGITIVMFVICGVGIATIILICLYSSIPVAVYFLTSAKRINSVLGFLVPGLLEDSSDSLAYTVKSAVSSGRLFGKGLGQGEFKYIIGQRIIGDFSFCNFAEELGYIGVASLFLILAIYVIAIFYRAYKSKENNLFVSNVLYGTGVLVSYQSFANILMILGLVPFEGVTFPFIAFGPEIIIFFVEFSFVLRSFKIPEENVLEEANEDFLS